MPKIGNWRSCAASKLQRSAWSRLAATGGRSLGRVADQAALNARAAGDQQTIDALEYRLQWSAVCGHGQHERGTTRLHDRVHILVLEDLIAVGV